MKKQLINVYSGFSLGALMGIILGISISEVAGIVLGGLTSLLVTFLGMKVETGENEHATRLMVAGFSTGCVLFILVGITFRTHDVLSPSTDDYIRQLKQLNLDSATIQRVVLLKKYGVEAQSGTKTDKEKEVHSSDAQHTFLFSAAEEQAQTTHEIAQRFSTYSLAQLATFVTGQGHLYEQFYNNVSQLKDSTAEKNLLVQLIVICYDYKKQ